MIYYIWFVHPEPHELTVSLTWTFCGYKYCSQTPQFQLLYVNKIMSNPNTPLPPNVAEIVAQERKQSEQEEKEQNAQQKVTAQKRKKILKSIEMLERQYIRTTQHEIRNQKRIQQNNIDFVLSLDKSAVTPTICDEIVQYNLEKCGCDCPDPRIRRLIGIAAKKFLHDICQGAMDYRKHRIDGMEAKKKKHELNKPVVLELDYLLSSLKERGIVINRTKFDIGARIREPNK